MALRAWFVLSAFIVTSGCVATIHDPSLTSLVWGHAVGAKALPRFSQVDAGLFRGGQPSEEGIRWLAQQGVKTIVSLRYSHAGRPRERELAQQLGLRWVSIPTRFWWRPTDGQIRQFLALALDPSNRPLFVHCHRGQNRTGIMVAIYRIIHGWSPRSAYAEARSLGMGWWNVMGRHLILDEAKRGFVRQKAHEPFGQMAVAGP